MSRLLIKRRPKPIIAPRSGRSNEVATDEHVSPELSKVDVNTKEKSESDEASKVGEDVRSNEVATGEHVSPELSRVDVNTKEKSENDEASKVGEDGGGECNITGERPTSSTSGPGETVQEQSMDQSKEEAMGNTQVRKVVPYRKKFRPVIPSARLSTQTPRSEGAQLNSVQTIENLQPLTPGVTTIKDNESRSSLPPPCEAMEATEAVFSEQENQTSCEGSKSLTPIESPSEVTSGSLVNDSDANEGPQVNDLVTSEPSKSTDTVSRKSSKRKAAKSPVKTNSVKVAKRPVKTNSVKAAKRPVKTNSGKASTSGAKVKKKPSTTVSNPTKSSGEADQPDNAVETLPSQESAPLDVQDCESFPDDVSDSSDTFTPDFIDNYLTTPEPQHSYMPTFPQMERKVKVARPEVFEEESPELSELRLIDAIFYNPPTSPMSHKANSNESVEQLDSGVTLNSDGQLEVSDGGSGSKPTRGRRRIPSHKWSRKETIKFYQALQQLGPNFTFIAQVFPGLDRVVMMRKFKKEQRDNPHLIHAVLTNPKKFSFEGL